MIDSDAYNVHCYNSGRELEGLPTEELVSESLSAGSSCAVFATYDSVEARWEYVGSDDRERLEYLGKTVRTVYVMEAT